MPVGGLSVYPVLVRHRLEVHLDPGAVDANADETNMNGWENPRSASYTDEKTKAYLAKEQYRRFVTNSGEKLAMNGERNSETGTESQGMNQAYRDGYVLDGW